MENKIAKTNSGGYGPDNNLSLDRGKCYKIDIPPFARLELSFDQEAGYENAICIYNNQDQKILEKGNYGRLLSPESIAGTTTIKSFLVSGWHKNGGPNASLPWIQSPVKLTLSNDGFSGIIGFEDAGDGDYNDIRAIFKFIPA